MPTPGVIAPPRPAGRVIATCAEALLLRRQLLPLLATSPTPPADADVEKLRGIDARAWRVFLSEEGCAAVVQATLIRAGLLERLSAEARHEVEVHTLAETQRTLSARRQLRELARIAERRQWSIVVLKGGVGVAEGDTTLYLTDLDVLVPPEIASDLASELAALGYGGGEDNKSHHLTPSVAAGGLPIEIHLQWDSDAATVDPGWWSRTVALERFAPLRRPSDRDQLWHLLVHTVERHAELRGRIRDMIVATKAARRLNEDMSGKDASAAADQSENVAELGAAVGNHLMRAAMEKTLEFIRSFESGTIPDPFVARAAARYTLRLLFDRVRIPQMLRGQLIALTISLVDGPSELRHYARRVLPTVWRSGASRDRDPAFRSLLERLLRIARRSVAQMTVALMAPFLALLARRALTRLPR